MSKITTDEYLKFNHAAQQTLNDLHEMIWVNESVNIHEIANIFQENFITHFGINRANEILGINDNEN